MRTSRIARSLAIAGIGAMLSLLSIASVAMACTNGGGFPTR